MTIRSRQLLGSRRSEVTILARTASPLMLANLINAVLSSGIILLATRYLDPSTYGKYAVILGVIQTVEGLLSAGVTAWGTREIAARPDSTPVVFASMLKFLAVVSATMTIGAFVAMAFLSVGRLVMIAAMVLTLQTAIRTLGQSAIGVLIAHRKTSLVARANIVESLTSVIVIPVFLLAGFGLVGLAVGELLATTIQGFIAFRGTRKTLGSRLKVWEGHLRWAVRSSRAFWLTQSSFGISNRLQVVMVGLSSSPLSGFYALGQRIFESSLFAISPLSTILVPHVTHELPRLGKRQLLKNCSTALLLGAAIGALMGVALFAASITVLPTIIGSEYQAVFDNIWLLCITMVFLFTAQVLYAYLISLEKERFLARSSWISALLLLGGLAAVSRQHQLSLLYAFLLLWYILLNIVWMITLFRKILHSDHRSENPGGEYAVQA